MSKPTIGICVDSSYSLTTKLLEWRVVDIESGKEIYKNSLYSNTLHINNLGEFFALCRGIYHVLENNLDLVVYSDSTTSISWIENCRVNTTIKNKKLLILVEEGLNYINRKKVTKGLPKIEKWNSKSFGDIPADFGRKNK